MLCKNLRFFPHTQVRTSQAVSAHVIHKFIIPFSLLKLYLCSLTYPRNCNQGNFAICLFLEVPVSIFDAKHMNGNVSHHEISQL